MINVYLQIQIRGKGDFSGFIFKTSYMKFSVVLDAATFTSLHLDVQPLPGQGRNT
jgi:hypothetical protein